MANLDERPSARSVIEIDRRERDTVVRIVGGLDQTAGGALSMCIGGLAAEGESVVLDLADVPYCDAEGLGALLGAHRRLDGRLEVRNLVSGVRHLIVERGLDRILRVS